jgi:hypothetical protein
VPPHHDMCYLMRHKLSEIAAARKPYGQVQRKRHVNYAEENNQVRSATLPVPIS